MSMRKRARTSLDSAIVNVWKREVGEISTKNFADSLTASEDLVLRLDVFRRLKEHRGWVNTVSFSADGDILVSSSNDRKVTLWDWETGKTVLSFHSGHDDYVFQAKTMPHTDNRSIVTCAADGQILERGYVTTNLLAKHQGLAPKLAIEPGSPNIFYTCGYDGLVQHIDLRTEKATELFTCRPFWPRNYTSLTLSEIVVDPRNPYFFAVAGADEFARIFDMRKYSWDGSADFGRPVDYFCPSHLVGIQDEGITGLSISNRSELLVSYFEEVIYLLTKDMGLGPDPSPISPSPVSHDSYEGEMDLDDWSDASPPFDAGMNFGPQFYMGHKYGEELNGVTFLGPRCEYIAGGSDCGRIYIWNKKSSEVVRVMEADRQGVSYVVSHPHTTVLASCGMEPDTKIWTPKALDRAVLPTDVEKRRPKLSDPRIRCATPWDEMCYFFSGS
ncbi:uncharacterized protein LOC107771848 isoform X2 [Nicotiana tabacum]|uniref:DDB1- and CUL4-associated factor 8 isoform X2 n=2 Tax=Nicotiana TaxID=4085 RepID=A0A1S3Y4I9_TOBAC|nr:PREDICTED: DDB1- and CUL4-associated factor 8-like isoform X2 [Nicotiana sylvestris]XP_016446787.1 PREDICTED: DDB1- and CUL4-associated factor 8-like isoform X2 [Nicotiana tabacum]